MRRTSEPSSEQGKPLHSRDLSDQCLSQDLLQQVSSWLQTLLWSPDWSHLDFPFCSASLSLRVFQMLFPCMTFPYRVLALEFIPSAEAVLTKSRTGCAEQAVHFQHLLVINPCPQTLFFCHRVAGSLGDYKQLPLTSSILEGGKLWGETKGRRLGEKCKMFICSSRSLRL